MKLLTVIFSLLLLLTSSSLEAATKPFKIKNRFTKYVDGVKHTHKKWVNHQFRVEIIGDRDGRKTEQKKKRIPFVIAQKNERYSIRVYNPLPVRVAVNLTVDGINTITGKPSGISDGRKWMIRPHDSITIRGWQVGDESSRRFYFTEKPKSYANWRSQELDQDLSVNCGVIGAAFFWNKKELQRYYDNHPQYVYTKRPYLYEPLDQESVMEGKAYSSRGALSKRKSSKAIQDRPESHSGLEEKKAGTGMGEREHHPVREVEFRYDTGMYKLSQALLIYYDFVDEPQPNPFPGLSFAPEMPY